MERKRLQSYSHDEGHLSAQHGKRFRWQIRAFANILVKPMLSSPLNALIITMLTATMSKSDLSIHDKIFGIVSPPRNTIWSSKKDFEQHQIEMQLKIGSDYTKSLDAVVEYLQTTDGSVYVITNS